MQKFRWHRQALLWLLQLKESTSTSRNENAPNWARKTDCYATYSHNLLLLFGNLIAMYGAVWFVSVCSNPNQFVLNAYHVMCNAKNDVLFVFWLQRRWNAYSSRFFSGLAGMLLLELRAQIRTSLLKDS